MFTDVCFPKQNEKEFIEVALKLRTKNLIFIYPNKKSFDDNKKKYFKEKKLKIDFGILMDEKNMNKIQDYDYVFSKTPSRKIVESKKAHVLFDFELQTGKDFMHHRNAGVNQVIAKIIKEHNKLIGFSFSSVLNSKNPGVILGRMQQNARLARKYKLKTVAASFANKPEELRAKKEIKSFEKIIGV